jgi:hypothetical protein
MKKKDLKTGRKQKKSLEFNGLRRKQNSGRRNNFKRPRKRIFQVAGDTNPLLGKNPGL